MKKALSVIARAGDGSVRDALSIADMVIAYSNGNLTYENVAQVVGNIEKDKLYSIVKCVLEKDLGGMLEELDKILAEGKPAVVLSKELISYFRDLLVIMTVKEEKAKEMVIVPNDIFVKMKEQAIKENFDKIVSSIEILSDAEQDLRYSVQPKIVLESCMIKVMNFINLENRVAAIESQLQGNLEVKKKIITPEIKKQVASIKSDSSHVLDSNVLGKLMSYLRQNGYMLAYAGVAEADKVELNGDTLLIEAKQGSSASGLVDEANKLAIEKFA